MAKSLEPPYPYIRRELLAGRVIPFLGAGASFGSRDPGKQPWRAAKTKHAKMAYLPTASELADWFAKNTNFPKDETRELAKVAQYYAAIIGRPQLQQELQSIFAFMQQPGSHHRYLAEAAAHTALLIVTTNYDDLLERAFVEAGRPFDTVIHATQPSKKGEVLWIRHGSGAKEVLAKNLDIDLTRVNVIYKIHGSIDRSLKPSAHYVITEDDYIEFLGRLMKTSAIPNIFVDPFQRYPFLFMGYGLYDWNLRVVLNRIDKLRGQQTFKSWAIETRSKPLEKEFWSKRNVAVFDDLTLDEFIKKLRKAKT